MAAEKYYARNTDCLISVGEQVADELRELGIGLDAVWASIAPGINPMVLPARSLAGECLGIDPAKKTIGWLGRFVGVKDPKMMVEIARLIPHVQFLMAGEGELLEEIRQVAPPNLFTPGWVPRENVLACSDLLVMTSISEGMPLAAVEAQFAGIPVIVPRVGSLPEVVADGESGLIVDREVGKFVKAISDLLLDSSRSERLASGARLRAQRSFTVERMVKEHVKIYDTLLEGSR